MLEIRTVIHQVLFSLVIKIAKMLLLTVEKSGGVCLLRRQRLMILRFSGPLVVMILTGSQDGKILVLSQTRINNQHWQVLKLLNFTFFLLKGNECVNLYTNVIPV